MTTGLEDSHSVGDEITTVLKALTWAQTSTDTSLLGILRALESLSKELGDAAPLSYARTLLYVAIAGDGGLDQGQLVKQLYTSPSAAVRAVQALGKFSWVKDEHGNRKPGRDLIDSVHNPHDYRLRTLTLTDNGRNAVAKLGGSLKG